MNRITQILPDVMMAVLMIVLAIGGVYVAWATQHPAIVAGMTIGILIGAIAAGLAINMRDRSLKDNQRTREARQAARKASNATPAYVRESKEADGFFEVVGGTDPTGKPYKTYFTTDQDEAETLAAERRASVEEAD